MALEAEDKTKHSETYIQKTIRDAYEMSICIKYVDTTSIKSEH